MRAVSVLWTSALRPRLRRRLALLVCNKCRRPARLKKTLPLALILNRLTTDFFVFCIENQLSCLLVVTIFGAFTNPVD